MSVLRAAIAIAALLCQPLAGHAQETAGAYPSRTIRLVVPSEPGGGADIQGRLYSARISEQMNRQMIVENRAGAAQEIGHIYVAKAPADGYTLLLASPAFSFIPAMSKTPSYDPVKQFAPVIQMSRSPYVLYVRPALPINSLQDYLAYAKAHPGALNIGVVGPGGFTHLAAAWLNNASGAQVTYIPYKGTGPIITDVIAGRLDAAFGNPLSVLPVVKLGKARLIGVSTAQRARAMPDLPTLAEQGVAGYDLSTWQSVFVPAGTPAAIVAKLNAEFDKVLKSPGMAEKLAEDGSEAVGGSPEQLRKQIANEVAHWSELIPAIGLERK
jgi:tripartite-type tricarboxylate transporter receptor subunit TctC